MKFRDLKIGDTFDFVNPNDTKGWNSFFFTVVKTSSRGYKDLPGEGTNKYEVGSINCEVYHVNDRK